MTKICAMCGFRYHQKIPSEVPELESTEVGIAQPVEFALPSHNPRWKPEIFAAFDIGKAKPQVFIVGKIILKFRNLRLLFVFFLNTNMLDEYSCIQIRDTILFYNCRSSTVF